MGARFDLKTTKAKNNKSREALGTRGFLPAAKAA